MRPNAPPETLTDLRFLYILLEGNLLHAGVHGKPKSLADTIVSSYVAGHWGGI